MEEEEDEDNDVDDINDDTYGARRRKGAPKRPRKKVHSIIATKIILNLFL